MYKLCGLLRKAELYKSSFINSDWKAAHHNAAISLENREEKLDEVYNQIERNLDLLGATAIEDKLQVWDFPATASPLVLINHSNTPAEAIQT